MIDKQKILEILNKESVSENSSNNNRVIIEQDFEIIADEIVKLFAIPIVVKSLPSEIEIGKAMSELSKVADKEIER